MISIQYCCRNALWCRALVKYNKLSAVQNKVGLLRVLSANAFVNVSIVNHSSCSSGWPLHHWLHSKASIYNLVLEPRISATVLKESQRRYAKKQKAESDSESSDDEDLDSVLDKYDRSSKVIKCILQSLRLDLVLKSALGLARNKVDIAFYESRIRVNGEKVLKKSQRVNIGDEIDIIKGVSPLNPNFLNIARVEIVSAKPDDEDEGIKVKLRRFKTLQIENYEVAPYKQEAS